MVVTSRAVTPRVAIRVVISSRVTTSRDHQSIINKAINKTTTRTINLDLLNTSNLTVPIRLRTEHLNLLQAHTQATINKNHLPTSSPLRISTNRGENLQTTSNPLRVLTNREEERLQPTTQCQMRSTKVKASQMPLRLNTNPVASLMAKSLVKEVTASEV